MTKTVQIIGKSQRAGWVRAGMSTIFWNITSEFQPELLQQVSDPAVK